MKKSRLNKKNKKARLSILAVIGFIITAIPAKAADNIYFYVGPAEFSVSVDSLSKFAHTGVINQDLSLYLQNATPEELAEFRKTLLLQTPSNPIQVFQFFNTPIGEDILTRIGELINIPGGINGKFALRSALIEASQDPQGFTMLNLLRKFPGDIELNTKQIIKKANNLELLVKATNISIEEIGKLSNTEAAKAKPVDFAAQVDPRKPGEFGYIREVFTLNDSSRQRKFKVILYKPQQLPEGKIPVVVISHGLASRPEDFEKYGQQLATYGFLVVLPQHPGSDNLQFQAMLEGRSGEVFLRNEFIDRPKDVTYLLDHLSQRNLSDFEGRLDLDNVGIMGHSFGGYTALALAGAQLDFDRLAKDCDLRLALPNPSLLLQCRALELPRQAYDFRDPRVKAVLALNPVDSSLFGPKGLNNIQTPVFLFAGEQDLAAPAILEQVRSFLWINNPNKYLAVAKGDIHVDTSQLDAGTVALMQSLPGLQFADRSLIDSYTYSMMVAFFQYYLKGDPTFQTFLQSSYSQYISVNPFQFYLITSPSSQPLQNVLIKLKPKN